MEKNELVALVTAAQSGDSDAVNRLFNEFYSDVYYFALKTVKDSDLAQDITQEAFVEIINTLGKLSEPAAFVTWMKQITYHQCTRYFKKKKDILIDEDEDGHTVFDTLKEENIDFIPDEALDKQDFKATVLSMLDGLSEEQRSATLLFYFDELSVKEIAKIQNVSEGTVKSRLNYARKTIKSAVNEYEKKNGVKLHAVPFIPLVKWLFAGNTPTFAAPISVANGISAATGVGVTASAGVVGGASGTTIAAVGLGAKIAAAPLALKITAVTVAASIALGGGAAATVITIQNSKNNTSSVSSATSTPTSSVPEENSDKQTTCLVLEDIIPEGCTYTTVNGEVFTAGDPFPEESLEGDFVEYKDYRYGYQAVKDPESGEVITVTMMGDDFDDMCLRKEDMYGAWMPMVIDLTKESYGEIASSINGKPINGLYATYMLCKNIKNLDWLRVPDSVTFMVATFVLCEGLTDAEAFVIPDKVNNVCGLFMDCKSLKNAPDLHKNIKYAESTFDQCVALEDTIRIDCNAEDFDSIFESTVLHIDLIGDSDRLVSMAQTGRNGNVTVKGEKVNIPVMIYGENNFYGSTSPMTINTHQIETGIRDPHLAKYTFEVYLRPYGGTILGKDGNEHSTSSPFIAIVFPKEQPLIPQHLDNRADTAYAKLLISDIGFGNTPVPSDAAWNELFENEEYFALMGGTEYNGIKYITWQTYAGGGDVDIGYYDYTFSEDGSIVIKQNPDYYDFGHTFFEKLVLSADNHTLRGVATLPWSAYNEEISLEAN